MNYPKNMIEFIDSFHTENQCLEYLKAIKWGGVCPKCDGQKLWKITETKKYVFPPGRNTYFYNKNS